MKRIRIGLTIIEALIAMTLMGVVFVALASLQISNLRVTGAASADSQLLQAAVGEFEALRTVVLNDFKYYYDGCAGNCPDTVSRVSFDEGESFIDGLLQITISVEQRGRTLIFNQYVSCLDSRITPTISDVSECTGEG